MGGSLQYVYLQDYFNTIPINFKTLFSLVAYYFAMYFSFLFDRHGHLVVQVVYDALFQPGLGEITGQVGLKTIHVSTCDVAISYWCYQWRQMKIFSCSYSFYLFNLLILHVL